MTLEKFLLQLGVAIIGASSDPSQLGYAVARNLIQGGYPGIVHLVNPKGGELFGHAMHTSIAEAPDPVDLAVVIVPAPAAAQALREIGQRGIRARALRLVGLGDEES